MPAADRPALSLAPPPLPPGLLGLGQPLPSRLAEARRLRDLELQLLSRAVGEHLPPELADQVEELRERRAALGA